MPLQDESQDATEFVQTTDLCDLAAHGHRQR